MIRLALFASGQGSNALHLLETAKGLSKLSIPLLIVDQVSSPLPEKVRKLYSKTEVQVIPRQSLENREESRNLHEQEILTQLKAHAIDWCFLAGYLRLVGPTLLCEYSSDFSSRMVNIHPSLLPAYPGLHAYEKAFAAGERVSGITIHFVDSGMDTGMIIRQEKFNREPDDTLETFSDRGKALEWKLYAEVLTELNDRGNLKPLLRNA